jgi:glycosyltransferase involved in cell wall biosynthesis
MFEKFKISVLVPVYNSSLTISRALHSVVLQDYKNLEVIIVNDASIDTSKLYFELSKFYEILNIKVFDLDNNYGAGYARNFGIAKCTGDYIAFLDADDIWYENKLKTQIHLMVKNDLFITAHKYNFNFSTSKSVINLKIKFINKFMFLIGKTIFTPTIMIKNKNIYPFNEKFRTSEDWFFVLNNLYNNSASLYFIDSTFASGFKKPMGDSGAGSDIFLCHKDRINLIFISLKLSYINIFEFIIVFTLEYLKFPIRLFKYYK